MLRLWALIVPQSVKILMLMKVQVAQELPGLVTGQELMGITVRPLVTMLQQMVRKLQAWVTMPMQQQRILFL